MPISVSSTVVMLPPEPVKGKARVHEAAEALLSMNMAATATQPIARSPSPVFLPHRIANMCVSFLSRVVFLLVALVALYGDSCSSIWSLIADRPG